jgi:hypothetical protein
MKEELIYKFGEIQYLKGRLDELHKALPTVLDLHRRRKLDVRLSKYYNKLRATDELAYHLYIVERETQMISKEKSKKIIEELLIDIKRTITDVELIERIDKQIENYGH